MTNTNPDDTGVPYHSIMLYQKDSGHNPPPRADYTLLLFPSPFMTKRRMAM